MAPILCPTRGGEPSYPNQDRAILLAKERDERLLFLFVADVSFLGGRAGPVLVDVEEQIEEMGEFLLEMAQERAEKEGVSAGAEVRWGDFRGALASAIEEHQISTVVLGSPGEESAITTMAYLKDLTQSLVEDLGVEVILLWRGEIVDHEQS